MSLFRSPIGSPICAPKSMEAFPELFLTYVCLNSYPLDKALPWTHGSRLRGGGEDLRRNAAAAGGICGGVKHEVIDALQNEP